MYSSTPRTGQVSGSPMARTTTASLDARKVLPNKKLKMNPRASGSRIAFLPDQPSYHETPDKTLGNDNFEYACYNAIQPRTLVYRAGAGAGAAIGPGDNPASSAQPGGCKIHTIIHSPRRHAVLHHRGYLGGHALTGGVSAGAGGATKGKGRAPVAASDTFTALLGNPGRETPEQQEVR